MILNDPEQKDNIRAVMAQGKTGDFWQLIQQSLDQSIERLEAESNGQNLKDLPAADYKLEDQLLKAKINYLKHLKDLPDTITSWLQQPDQTQPNLDPYSTATEFMPHREKEEA